MERLKFRINLLKEVLLLSSRYPIDKITLFILLTTELFLIKVVYVRVILKLSIAYEKYHLTAN